MGLIIFNKKEKCKSNADLAIERIQEMSERYEPGTEEFRRCRQDYEQEIRNKKLEKECKHAGIDYKVVIAAVSTILTTGIAVFALSLDQESPKALKLADFVLRIFKKQA